MKSAATLVISRNEQPDANFEILVDGKPRSHRDRKDVAIRIRGISQEPKPAQRRHRQRPAEWRSDRGRYRPEK
jgi:hypothetical protein